jgi:hypothetical protein
MKHKALNNDPRGLTAAGRAELARKEGARLWRSSLNN